MTEIVGRYEILEEIGQGGFATVYRAHDGELDRLVALKELKPVLLQDKNWVKRFHREARAIARLDHPRIVTVYDVTEIGERLFIVMRLVAGPSLEEHIIGRGHLTWSEAVAMTAAVAEGLDYAHQHGVLHRDLKPANILVDPERGPQLTDFGLAKLAGEHSLSATASGSVVGTPHYIAPEVWEGQSAAAESDVYALGCILYEMITGEKVFKGETPPAVMLAHFKPLDLPAKWPAGVPAEVSTVLKTALANQPARRYRSAGKLAAALVALSDGEPPEILPGPEPTAEVVQPSQPETSTLAAEPSDLDSSVEPATEAPLLIESQPDEVSAEQVEPSAGAETSPAAADSARRIKRPRPRRRRSGCGWLSVLLVVGLVMVVGIGLGGLCSAMGGLFTVGSLFKALPTVEVGATQVEEIYVPLTDASKTTEVEIRFDSGELSITSGAQSGLVEGTATFNVPQLEPKVITSSNMVRLEHETALGLANVTTQNVKNRWDLKLGTAPLALDIEASFMTGKLELGGLSLHNLSVNPGAGEIELSFLEPNLVQMNTLQFKTHAAKVTLHDLANARVGEIKLDGTAGEYILDFSGKLQQDVLAEVNTTSLSEVTIIVPAGVAAQVSINGNSATVVPQGNWREVGGNYVTSGEGSQITIEVDIGSGTLNLRNS